ncbi:MAG: phosphogluconate dehydrogenase (NAD(+)-dependent, decarboxylating) [Enterococcus hulanensis]
MQIGFIGLGKMGLAMATRGVKGGHDLIALDHSQSARDQAQERGIKTVASLTELLEALSSPRVIWLQTPPGEPTQNLIHELSKTVDQGDIIVDAGNSDFRDTKKNADYFADLGINFVDAGVSGGVSGAKNGCGLLVGAKPDLYDKLTPFFDSLAAPNGYCLCGDTGAGHYSKTIHNGVEYALMQAYAEGYEMLISSDIKVDVLTVMQAYQGGCSIRSHLLSKVIEALEPDPTLNSIEGYVADSGMGRWTVEEAIKLKVPTPTITAALQARFRSQQEDSPQMQCLAALRGAIGGHPVKRKGAAK